MVYLSASLRALYLADNEFETIPPEVSKLKNLQIVSKYAVLKIQITAQCSHHLCCGDL